MSARLHLGIDVGGTASRWVACDDRGTIIARGKTSGATGHVFNPVEKDRLQLALQATANQLAAHGLTITTVTAGLTGYGAAVADQLKPMLTDVFAVTDANIILVDDMTLAYASIFAPGEGHLVSAGTGSIGLHIEPDSAVVRVGGRGILIDDAGSGSWIALRALDRIFRSLDRTGTFADVAQLAEGLFAIIGGDDWDAVRQFVYGGDRGKIGTLALAVGVAATAGDEASLTILREAGEELALLGKALIARGGKRSIGFVGGVLELHSSVAAEITRHLADHDVLFPEADAAMAAALLQGETKTNWKHRILSMTS